ncbi:hypothetical protein JNG76_03570 [Proteus mirabilis]|uniref:hypothetical protein n=3 Tax=Proteus mirabilis TaxID=584 RepID=UPI001BA14349|nr:hypothetical protein [Proteus mirabilis]MCI9766297.1 hypothetical protein [Proteus mirabilis]MCI9769884.1 hypothetical protein [Proteus mirabilis]MCI9773478.1 hypothetical protein [Proteus mirabilis]MDM3647005.1 hypothetical protein [Proteus mirabilis]HBC8711563.1 hypothetical protein [Proteus mirabilis]
MMSVKINQNDISTSQILRISQGEKAKDVMSLWAKIKDWFQSNKREKALKTIENIVSKELFDEKKHFNMVYHVLMLKTMASDAYKERIKINMNDKNITILIDNYSIFIKDIDNEQLNKISAIINAFNRHSSVFSNEIALKCLYEKLEKNEINDQLFAELYLELDNKISSGEIDLELNKSNFNQVDFYAISKLVSKVTDKDNTNLDTEKALMKDINRNTYIINGKEIKSKDQKEAMKQFELLIKDISEENKKAIYYLLNQEGITLIKSYNDAFDYYTLTTSFFIDGDFKQRQIYSIKSLSDDLIEMKINYFKKSSDKVNQNITLAQSFESKLYNFIYDTIAINNNIEITDDNSLNKKIKEIKEQLNNKESNLGEKFLDLLYRNKVIKEDSINITLKLNKGELVSLDGECSYKFY